MGSIFQSQVAILGALALCFTFRAKPYVLNYHYDTIVDMTLEDIIKQHKNEAQRSDVSSEPGNVQK